MRRTELIPQTTAAINSGKVWYHFSIMHAAANAPSVYREHQICFFESHFTELKSGWISGESGTSDPLLRWDISGTTHWSTNFTAGVWHNVAYEIVNTHIPFRQDVLLTATTGLQRRVRGVLALNGIRSVVSDGSSCQRLCIFEWRRLASRCPGTPGFWSS